MIKNNIKILFLLLMFVGTIFASQQNKNPLLNPEIKKESIIDIGYTGQVIPYSASIPKGFIEVPALSRKIDTYIRTLKRDHTVTDCVTDGYGATTCPQSMVECQGTAQTKRGTSVKHNAGSYSFYTYECNAGANIDDAVKVPTYENYSYNTLNNGPSPVPHAWGGILETYGIGVGTYNYPITIKTAGVYSFRLQVDNYASVYLDGSLVIKEGGGGWATVYNTTRSLSPGTYNLNIVSSNDNNVSPHAVAVLVNDPSGTLIWNTRTGQNVTVNNVYCPSGYSLSDNICYKQYSYSEDISIKDYERWSAPMNAGGDCRGSGLNASGECNSAVPPVGNCVKSEYKCPTNKDFECTKVSDSSSIGQNIYDGDQFSFGKTTHKSKEVITPKECAEGGTYNADKDVCVASLEYKCPVSGFVYNATQNSCLGEYSCNGVFSAVTGKCELEPNIQCPTGSVYDKFKQKCSAGPKCSSGTYNPVTFQCEQPAKCDTVNGWRLDPTINTCVKEMITIDPICPESFMKWNSVKHVCEGHANFNEWSKTYSGSDTGNWIVQDNGAQLYQTVNGDNSTYYMSTGQYSSSTIKGKMKVADGGNDDDSIGMVFGFRGLTDMYLLNWVKGSGAWTKGSNLMTLQKVTGTANYGLDNRVNYNGVNIGWKVNAWHEIEIKLAKNDIKVYLDGSLVIAETRIDLPTVSRMGFYNQSQSNVYYKDFYISTIPICSSGYIYSEEYDICYINNGAKLDFVNKLYLKDAICGINGIFDSERGKCLFNPICYSGGVLDPSTKTCVSQEINTCNSGTPSTGITFEKCNEATICPAPYVLNKNTNTCVSPIASCDLIDAVRGVCYQETTSCSAGYAFNSKSSRCEKPVTCANGGMINESIKSCEKQIANDCVNVHIAGFNKVCEQKDICAEGTIKTQTPEGYKCLSTKALSCPTGYVKDFTTSQCVSETVCPEGFLNVDGQCKMTYNWSEFSCDAGWTGPLIDQGKDCNAICGFDGCWCSEKFAPANNCKKKFTLTSLDNTYSLTEKRQVEYHNINGKGLSEGEYGELKNFECGNNCTFDLVSITGKNSELCFTKRNGESSCLTVDKCYFEGEINLNNKMPKESKIENIYLEDAYTIKSNYVITPDNMGIPKVCTIGVYSEELKKCVPTTPATTITKTGTVVDKANSIVTPTSGTVVDYQNGGSAKVTNGIWDYAYKTPAINEERVVYNNWRYERMRTDTNTLSWSQCQNGVYTDHYGQTINNPSYSMFLPKWDSWYNGNKGGTSQRGGWELIPQSVAEISGLGGIPISSGGSCCGQLKRICSTVQSISIPASCPAGYSDNGSNCKKLISYDYYQYTCPAGYEAIDKGVTSHSREDADVNSDNTAGLSQTVNSSVPPINNCKKNVTYKYYKYSCPSGYSARDLGVASFTKVDIDKAVDNQAELGADVNSAVGPAGNCSKTHTYNYYEYTCPSGFITKDRGLVDYIRPDNNDTSVDPSLSNPQNSSVPPVGNCSVPSVCPSNSIFEPSNQSCMATVCYPGFAYNVLDKRCDQSIVSTCKMNGNVGWKDRTGGIVSVANGNSSLNYALINVSGTQTYEANTTWEGFNIGKMAIKLSDGHWYVSSEYKDTSGNAVSRTLPDFVQKLNINNYQIYSKGSRCIDEGKNVSDYCATSFKIIMPEHKMSIIEIWDIESLNNQAVGAADNSHNLDINVSGGMYSYRGNGKLPSLSLNVDATISTKEVSPFIDRIDFWDSFMDGNLGYIEFLRKTKDRDSEEGFIIENKRIFELSKIGVNIIDYIPAISKSIYVSNKTNCTGLASLVGGSALNKGILTSDQVKILRNYGIYDNSCVIIADKMDAFSNIHWSLRKNDYKGNFKFKCSPFVCGETGSCDVASCPTEERSNPKGTVEYIGTLLPPEFIPKLDNIVYCMEQKCDANLDYIDYCGYYKECDTSNGNLFYSNGSCYEYYCKPGEILDINTKQCKKESCPAGTTLNAEGKCTLNK